MKNEYRKNIIIVVLIAIIILLCVFGWSVVLKKNSSDNQNSFDNSSSGQLDNQVDDNLDDTVEKQLSDDKISELNVFLADTLNRNIVYLSFLSPSDVLLNQNNLSYLEYIISRSSYAVHIPDEHMPKYSITLDGIKHVLKDKFNYNYSTEEIQKYFKSLYDKDADAYIYIGGGSVSESKIVSGYQIGEEYHLVLDNSANVILNRVNDNYYFNACMFQ